jgi:fructose-bisphosphate aldolase class 1
MVNEVQAQRMTEGRGFIAALDQSGGSTPKALAQYGIDESAYSSDSQMFDLIHQMRSAAPLRLTTSGTRREWFPSSRSTPAWLKHPAVSS